MTQKSQTTIYKLSNRWADQMAYYRFFNNSKVTTTSIISTITQDTAQRIEAEHYLIFQDTTQVNLEKNRAQIEANSGLGLIGDNRSLGFYLHPSLVVKACDESCVGFSFIKPYIHSEHRADRHERKYKTLPIEEKESYRWIESVENTAKVLSKASLRTSVQDREGDIFELLAAATGQDHLIVRSRDNRKILYEDKVCDLYQTLEESDLKGSYLLDIRGDIRHSSKNKIKRQALMELRFVAVDIIAPARKGKGVLPIKVWAIESKESSSTVPEGEQPVHWRILTTHLVGNFSDACQIVRWYSLRWHIETLFRLLKTQGFAIESIELENGESIIKMTLFALQAALRVMALLLASKANEPNENQQAKELFCENEIKCLQVLETQLSGNTIKQQNPYPKYSLRWAFWIIARLGGWKGYASQRPPGIITLNDGIKQFNNIYLGFKIAQRDMYKP